VCKGSPETGVAIPKGDSERGFKSWIQIVVNRGHPLLNRKLLTMDVQEPLIEKSVGVHAFFTHFSFWLHKIMGVHDFAAKVWSVPQD
jgi:hypothetical protein